MKKWPQILVDFKGQILIAVLAVIAFCVFTFQFDPATTTMPSVVLVETECEPQANPLHPFPEKMPVIKFHGSGFMVDGRLLTCNHVVEPPGTKLLKMRVVTSDGRSADAELVQNDADNDLSEIKTTIFIPSLRFAEYAPRRGDHVTQIGNPATMLFVISKGLVVAFDTSQGYNVAALDTYGGNSGGPEVNDRGEVIGMCHNMIPGTRFTGIGTLESLKNFTHPARTR